jgi:DNA-binding transcriptional LysR family regulator
MQFHNLLHFLAVCNTGSINKAAEKCNVSQPSITRSIKNLELEFGGVLFDRGARGCTLTSLGREIQPQFETLAMTLDAVKDVAQRNVDRSTSTLRFGFACTLGPAQILSYLEQLLSFSGTGPPRIFDAPSVNIVEQVLCGELDAGLVAEPSYPKSLAKFDLYEERFVVSFYKGHRFEKMSSVEFSELEHEHYVSRLTCELRGRVNEFVPNTQNFKMDVVFQSTQEQWIQNMVAAGGGIAIHPESMPVVDRILQRPLRNPNLSRRISLVMLESKSDLPVMRRLTNLTRRHFNIKVR